MTIWIDVEDLFSYAAAHKRVSGIQRVGLELCTAMLRADPKGVRFVRHGGPGTGFRTVPTTDILHLRNSFLGLDDPRRSPAPRTRRVAKSWRGRGWDRVTRALPPQFEHELRLYLISRQVAVRRLRARLLPWTAVPDEGPGQGPGIEDHRPLEKVAARGDVLLVLGSPWERIDYAYRVVQLRMQCGMRFALLVHDLIPILCPEWCSAGTVQVYRGWTGSVLPLADHIFSNSDATARDVLSWAEREGMRIADQVRTLPMGTGFSDDPLLAVPETAGDAPGAGVDLPVTAATTLPSPAVPRATATMPAGKDEGLTARVRRVQQRPYALFVSTIEARKNHLLAFRAWRQLLEELPREQVPTLVLAGRVGWLVADLMQQLENASWLDGHVVMVDGPTDAELSALYRGCGFTVFPSLYEGWGLPVSESLSFGKVCVASNRTSVPEAGGPYCLYHDPDSVSEAVALLRRVIEQPELIAEREAMLRRDFRPTPWSDAAGILLRTLGKRDDGAGRRGHV